MKIRYQARFAEAIVTPLADARIKIEFDNPLRDITPGQGAVIYNGEEVLGMGVIEFTLPLV